MPGARRRIPEKRKKIRWVEERPEHRSFKQNSSPNHLAPGAGRLAPTSGYFISFHQPIKDFVFGDALFDLGETTRLLQRSIHLSRIGAALARDIRDAIVDVGFA